VREEAIRLGGDWSEEKWKMLPSTKHQIWAQPGKPETLKITTDSVHWAFMHTGRSPETWDLISYTDGLEISNSKVAIVVVWFDLPVLDSKWGRGRRCGTVDELELSS
jgi:hypothetical protein